MMGSSDVLRSELDGRLSAYWEERARRFAVDGAGLRAVCSYGMPWFYNRYIHFLQWRALRRWLQVQPGTAILDVGCGIGRWSQRLARAGARVTGVDHSPTMITEARRRADAAGLGPCCRFLVGDIADLTLAARFDLILGVTVLQHVIDAHRVEMTIQRLAAHLAPAGRMVFLEAAPSCRNSRCDTAVFVARDEAVYQRAFVRAGLECVEIHGIDPAPFKTWLLPRYRRLPRPMAHGALLAATIAALPIDVLCSRWLPRAAWHKLFVLVRHNARGFDEPTSGRVTASVEWGSA